MSGDTKSTLLNLFKTLTPNKHSKEEVSLDDIDKIPLPKFPTEIVLKSAQTPQGGTTLQTTYSSDPVQVPPPGSTDKTIGLSDPNLQITDRFGEESIESDYVSASGVTKEGIMKAVKEAARIPRSIPFEIFNRNHLNACEGLLEVLYYIDQKNLSTAISYATPLVNEELLNFCISVVSRHREDFLSKDIQLPSHITTHPSTYVDVSRVESILYSREVSKTKIVGPIEIDSVQDFTATDADPEHLVAYFREDIGINLHHRHWHEVYANFGIPAISNLDRRGELFVYMHSQILARYNFERLCTSLDPVKKFSNFREPIMEAYYPKLDEASELKVWSPRQPFAQLRDVSRRDWYIEVADMERWVERIIDTIDRGFAIKKLKDGTEELIKLEEPYAINDLGNTIEAVPNLSYNYKYYGDLHTNGHIFIAFCHDPDERFKEPGGVMGKLEAALRDPMFYRWHAFIDDIMDRYRRKLKHYSVEERQFQNVEIESVEIQTDSEEKNTIKTFWQQDRVDVTDGILSLHEVELKKEPEKVYVKFTHLQHKDFIYKFRVYNWRSKPTTGVVRVFMAPLHDETRREMKFNKLRKFMIELDKFTVSLRKGKNEFTRKSTCSSVTIPFEQTFMTSEEAVVYSTDPDKRKELLSYCGCGWPHHLLIGRGRENGWKCTLFVMITDYDEDKVEGSTIESCGTSSISYCGVRNKKYPDKRPMGFPFDRPIEDSEAYLSTFMTVSQQTHDKNQEKLRNMYQTQFKVKFVNEKVTGPTCQSTTVC